MNTSGFQGRLKRLNLDTPGLDEKSLSGAGEHNRQIDPGSEHDSLRGAPRFFQMLGSLLRAARSRSNS